MARKTEAEDGRLDDAARAGWLYYVAGNTQEEIARKLGISRQSAQRLVSLAISERLIKVRLDHPIARCMELAAALKQRFDLHYCEVAPTDPARPPRRWASPNSRRPKWSAGCASAEPAIIGIGTGRTMRAVADQLPAMECPQHKLVALVGTTKTDGSASFYDVDHSRFRHRARAALSDAAAGHRALGRGARIADRACASVRSVLALVERADVSFVGVGAHRRHFGARSGRLHHARGGRRRCAGPARSAKSPAGRSMRTGG